jgi:hypothetical protein
MANREEVEAYLNSVRASEPEIWETLLKPVWYMEKYNCYPRYLSLMEAYSKSIDNTKRYTSNVIEVRECTPDVKFPELPEPETDKIITLETKDQTGE